MKPNPARIARTSLVRTLFAACLFSLPALASAQAAPTTITAVTAGDAYSMFVTSDGKLWTMGNNDYGQLGDGTFIDRNTPTLVTSASNVTTVAAGVSHSLYLTSDDKLYITKGTNEYTQLEDGIYINGVTPALVASASNIVAVAANGQHSLYVTDDGKLYAMGNNEYGQLGISDTTTYRDSPVLAPSASNVIGAAAGEHHSLYVTGDGKLYAMGRNDLGQLGIGTTEHQSTPVLVPSASNVIAAAAGYGNSLYLTVDGELYATGWNDCGQLGNGTTTEQSTPVQVTSASNVIAVAAGSYHNLYLTADGKLYGMGSNYFGQLGVSGTANRLTPVQVTSASNVIAMAAGDYHSLYVTDDDKLFAMGRNDYGQLGDGTYTDQESPVLILDLSNPENTAPVMVTQPISQVAASGGTATFTVAATGTPAPGYQWYLHSYGSYTLTPLTNDASYSGATTATLTITKVTTSMDNSQYHCVAKNAAGSAGSDPATLIIGAAEAPQIYKYPVSRTVTIGQDTYFTIRAYGIPAPAYRWQCSTNGSTWVNLSNDGIHGGVTTDILTITSAPAALNCMRYRCIATNAKGTATSDPAILIVDPAIPPPSSATITAVAAGGGHNLYVMGDGRLWAQGANGEGQLGIGTTESQDTPVQVTSATNVIAVAAGSSGWPHSLYVTKDGKLYAMGYNRYGQLGISNTTSQLTPVLVSSASNVIAAAAGKSHSLYITNDGKLYAMGDNAYGQLGLGDTTNRSTPEQVTSVSNVIAVAAGNGYSLYITDGGKLYGMGNNYSGQLGVSGTTNRLTPVQVASASNVIAVAAGNVHSLFVTNDGNLRVMGSNNQGQLGLGDYTDRSTPTLVTSASNVTAVFAGWGHSLYLTGDGNLWGMGYDYPGSLGFGDRSAQHTTPARILSATNVTAVAAGDYHSLFVTGGNRLWAMGDGDHGLLGVNYTPDIILDFSNDANVVPAIVTQPVNQAVETGQNAAFSVAATGIPEPIYQWEYNIYNASGWMPLTDTAPYGGATTNTLTITNAASSMNDYRYRCIVKNLAGSVTSDPATLWVGALSAITMQPGNRSVTAGASTSLSITATGSMLVYQWQSSSDDGATWGDLANTAPYSGVTTATLAITSTPATLNGTQYRCVVTNAIGTVRSSLATLTVNILPAITTQPANTTIIAGANATFTVAATGKPPPTYQWQSSTNGTNWTNLSNSAPYGGVTTATLAITAAPGNLNGMRYRCVASNGTGPDATSAAATLTVNTLPAITTQPASQTVLAGQSVAFTVAATGFPAPACQWQVLGSDSQWVSLADNALYSGVTTANLTVATVTADMTGAQYRCIVTNMAGDATSTAATLTVSSAPGPVAPVIAWMAGGGTQTVQEGAAATFVVNVTAGSTPLTFTWWKNNTLVTGATTATCTTPATTYADNSATFKVEVVNSAGTASLTASLTVTPSPTTLAQQFKTQLETPGAATITVTGTLDLSLVGGVTATSGKTIVGEDTTATITGGITIPQTATDIVILGVNFTGGALAINGATDVDVEHCTFTDTPVVITGNADNIAFAWNRFTATTSGGAGGGSAMRITGSGTTTGILLHHNLWDGNIKTDMPSVTNARVAMFNNYITATGNTTATIAGSGAQILSEYNIYQNTRNPLAKQNGGLLRTLGNFMTATTGTTAPGDDKIFVPGYTHLMHATGIDTPGAAALATLITANAGNTAGKNSPTPAATAAAARISATVTGPGANATATSASVPHAGGFTLTATATGFTPSPATHQWYLDNFAITNATNAMYAVTNANAAAHSGAYAVAMKTPANEIVTSGAFTMIVGELAAPSITANPVSRTITVGDNVTFTVTATGEYLSYQWQKNNIDISGATTAAYTITNAQQSHAGNYTVRVSNAAGNATSNAATLTVNAAGGNNSGGSSGDGGGGGGGAPTLPGLSLIVALLALCAAKTRR
jgi:alpha-tubulin suppressor-like RCC1 family protein